MIKPLADRVVVKIIEAEDTTKGGIFLPTAKNEKSQIAEVIAVGPGGNVDGKEIIMNLKKGDRVVCSKYSGTEINHESVDYLILKQSDILAIIE